MTPAEDLDETAKLLADALEEMLELLYKSAPRDFAKPDVLLVLARDGEVALGSTHLAAGATPAQVGFFLGKLAKRLDEGTFSHLVTKKGANL